VRVYKSVQHGKRRRARRGSLYSSKRAKRRDDAETAKTSSGSIKWKVLPNQTDQLIAAKSAKQLYNDIIIYKGMDGNAISTHASLEVDLQTHDGVNMRS
jgi:hypothetical protein